MSDLFRIARIYLVKHTPFYAGFISDCVIDLNWKENPIDSSIRNGRVHIHVNLAYLEKSEATPREVALLLEQEVNALVNKHQIRARDHDIQTFAMASDITTSQLCSSKEFPEWAKRMTHSTASEMFGDDFSNAKEKAVEIYNGMLPPPEEMPADSSADSYDQSNGEGEDEGDGLDPDKFTQKSAWKETNTTEDQYDEILRDNVRKAERSSPGQVPGHLKDLVRAILSPPKVPWEDELKDFVASKISRDTTPSWKRRNRNYAGAPYIMKGKECTYTSIFAIFIDTSASVSSDNLKQFISEMQSIVEVTKSQVVVICIDHGWQSVSEFDGEEEFAFKGRGGTVFDPVIQFLNGEDVMPSELHDDYESIIGDSVLDGAIYLTDGECGCSEPDCSVDMLWVITEDGTKPRDVPGRIIQIGD